MKKAIIARIKEKIELNEQQYADNYIVKFAHSKLTTPESKKQIAAAEQNMKECEQRIVVLKALLKEETAK